MVLHTFIVHNPTLGIKSVNGIVSDLIDLLVILIQLFLLVSGDYDPR